MSVGAADPPPEEGASSSPDPPVRSPAKAKAVDSSRKNSTETVVPAAAPHVASASVSVTSIPPAAMKLPPAIGREGGFGSTRKSTGGYVHVPQVNELR
eukprot:gene14042-16598_t